MRWGGVAVEGRGRGEWWSCAGESRGREEVCGSGLGGVESRDVVAVVCVVVHEIQSSSYWNVDVFSQQAAANPLFPPPGTTQHTHNTHTYTHTDRSAPYRMIMFGIDVTAALDTFYSDVESMDDSQASPRGGAKHVHGRGNGGVGMEWRH